MFVPDDQGYDPEIWFEDYDGPKKASFDEYTKYHQGKPAIRSEEHTSELQSLTNLVCRLLLEKKKQKKKKQKNKSILKVRGRNRQTGWIQHTVRDRSSA